MMNTEADSVAHTGVLITRPAAQAEGICSAVEKAGLKPWLFPALEISLNSAERINSALRGVKAGDILVFVSPNSVAGVFNVIEDDLRQQLRSAQLAAVGRRTQAALEDEGLFVAIAPDKKHQNSEGLLQHELLQDLDARHVFIVRGQVGREILKEKLIERGAHPEYIQAYTRTIPSQFDATQVIAGLDTGEIGWVMLTSYEAFENLREMLGEGADARLAQIELIVAGARIARKIGAACPGLKLHEAEGASDQAMLEALERARQATA